MQIKSTRSLFIMILCIITVIGIGYLCAENLSIDEKINVDFHGFVLEKKKLLHNRLDLSLNRISKTLDEDGKQFDLILQDGKLKIIQDNITRWESPNEWWVDNFIIGDSDNDGFLNINFSVWKAGNYGKSKPFWVKENDMSVKNHFFVFDFVRGEMKPTWQSSNLSEPNCEFDIADIDRDGKNDLIVIEGDYSQKPSCNGNHISIWKWNGWGFSNEWRSKKGNFSNLMIVYTSNETKIVADGLKFPLSFMGTTTSWFE